MELEDFIKTIYLGDRACKKIILDSWAQEVKIQITCISRVRSEQWNYYTDEDIEDGYLVFEKVKNINFEPPGLIPNDFINDVTVEKLEEGYYNVIINISAGYGEGEGIDIDVCIITKSVAIEDPEQPNIRIRD
ncbi:DUF6258 family protein [Leptospira mayottensis]|uniref:DUF6258 family protein n=1 Tax=Leptospira mayottensis TaxID=1137606 RepID=UPI000E3584DC|nr:DUF6258 family protein [Leptospira mayottensis]AXR68386.1 hypothetical protein DPV73_10530 [Leptospira mayottensis]